MKGSTAFWDPKTWVKKRDLSPKHGVDSPKKTQHSTREYIQYVVRWCGVIFGIDLFLVVCCMCFYFKQIVGEMGGGIRSPILTTYLAVTGWLPPKIQHPLRMFPLKMTSWSITSISSPRCVMVWPIVSTNHQQKVLQKYMQYMDMKI